MWANPMNTFSYTMSKVIAGPCSSLALPRREALYSKNLALNLTEIFGVLRPIFLIFSEIIQRGSGNLLAKGPATEIEEIQLPMH